jgi:hypothetical protein
MLDFAAGIPLKQNRAKTEMSMVDQTGFAGVHDHSSGGQ